MLPKITPSRRTFLMGLGRFAVAAEVARHLPSTAFAAEGYCPPPSAWTDLAKQVSGGVLRPDDPFYADVCRPNNLRYAANLPAGIARCVTDADVQACIAWVKKLGIPFAVRSGGHNYAGYSTTGGLLIDMSRMVGATVGKDGLVTIRGGVLNSYVYTQMERLGRTVTHGRCDSVGAAGFLLGGGIGFNMRKFGMGSDLLRATTIVTADGAVRPVSGDDKLFWASRGGGGGNFGINTSFTLQTYPIEKVTVFKITWTTSLEKVLLTLLKRLAEAPDDFGSKISVTIPSLSERCAGVKPEISILGQLHPSKVTLKDIFGDTWEMAATRDVREDVDYWPAQDFLLETTYPYYYQEKSSYVTAAGINEEAVTAMFDWAAKMPATSLPSAFKFFQVGGAVNKTSPTATAYVHRGYDWLFSIEANWWRPTDSVPLVDAALDWQQGFYADANRRMKAAGAFQNFPDPSLADWQSAYYGENYRTLTEVKKAVDPTMLFTFPQAIKPA